jgi:hypothetical protein
MSLLSCFLDVSSLNLAALRRRLFFAGYSAAAERGYGSNSDQSALARITSAKN